MSHAAIEKNLRIVSLELLFVVLALVLMIGDQVFAACKMSRSAKANYFVSTETGTRGTFGQGSESPDLPTVIERCQEDSGQFLMFSLGVRRPDMYSDSADISFTGQISDSQCSISHSPFKTAPTFSEKQDMMAAQYRALRTCMYVEFYDLDNRPLDYDPNQARCKMTKTDHGTVIAEGDFCFVRIRPNNRFALHPIVKPDCTNPAFLKANDIQPQDVEAVLNAYTAGDDSGNSTDLNPLGSNQVRLYLQPSSQLLRLTEDFGNEMPRFPADYTTDLHMGSMKIRGNDGNYVVELNLLADNRNPQTCRGGVCTSPGDFETPVVGEVELNRINGGRQEFVDSWWHAGFIPARWQGAVKSMTHNLNDVDLKTGDRYSMTVTFVDPYDDFTLFLKGMEQFVIDLRQMEGTAGIDSLNSIPALPGLLGLPELDSLPGLSSPDMTVELDRVLRTIQKLGQDRQWPAYYDRVCDSRLATCMKAGSKKYFLKLTTEFTVGPRQNAFELNLKDVVVKRESPTFETYTKKITEFSKVVCGENP